MPNYLEAVKKYNKIYKWIEKDNLLNILIESGKDWQVAQENDKNFNKLRHPNERNIAEVIKSCEMLLNDIYNATNGKFGTKKKKG